MSSFLIIFLFFITACDYTSMNLNQQNPDGSQGSTVGTNENCTPEVNAPVSTNILDYQKIKIEVFDANCVRCHNPGRPSGGVDLTSYASVKARLTQIDFAVTRNVMPPSGPLDPVKKGMLSDWIKAGAPNTQLVSQSCTSIPPPGESETNNNANPVVDTVQPLTVMPSDKEINFTLVKERIFAFYCLSWHSDAGGNRDGVNLERYINAIDDLKDLKEVISEGSMPPRPRPTLSLLEKNVILRWIRLGAPQ